LDLRERVLETVEAGASRREAAERFEVSASSAIKWMQRWHETGSVAAKPSGGSISPLETYADWLLTLIAEQPGCGADRRAARCDRHRRQDVAPFLPEERRESADPHGTLREVVELFAAEQRASNFKDTGQPA
jgi:transposase